MVELGKHSDVAEDCSSYFPTLLVSLRLLIVLLILLILSFYFHWLTRITHHSFHIKVQQLHDVLTEGTVLGLQQISEFSAEGLDDVGEGSEGSIQNIANGLNAIDILTGFEVIDDID